KKFRTKLGHWAMNLDNVCGTLAVETLYSDPDCEEWLAQANAYMTANLEFAVTYIREHIPCITTYVPEGTYLLWLNFSQTSLRGEELRRFLVQECKVDLCDGWEFDPDCLDHMRLNCACTRATLEEALKRMEHVMDHER
ncbi:MAG: cystathionine beta-lyase, partial [Firmicutes bacterium]|nr:cystathionine beta-lyase [Bacillota bacterium]